MKIPVDECPAGPVLDAAVAEVLGWKRVGGGTHLSWAMPTGELRTREETSFRSFMPSTDITAAWDLVETESLGDIVMTKTRGLRKNNRLGDEWKWRAAFYPGDLDIPIDSWAVTASLAICRAFLKANGVTHIEMTEQGDGEPQTIA